MKVLIDLDILPITNNWSGYDTPFSRPDKEPTNQYTNPIKQH